MYNPFSRVLFWVLFLCHPVFGEGGVTDIVGSAGM